MYTVEPPQQGEVRFVLRRAGQLGVIEMAWHIPEARHDDSAALTVLDRLLSAGVTSRLYQSLVETQLTVEADSNSWQFLDPGLFTIEATIAPGIAHEAVEKAIIETIDRLKTEPVSEKELQKIKNMIETRSIFLRDSPLGVVYELSESEAVAD